MTDASNRIALDFIKRHEGLRLTAYRDVAGIWTIGYGSTGSHVQPGMVISEAEAEALLLKDMGRFIETVDQGITVPLNPHQRAALISFAFNVGVTAFAGSTLARILNDGNYAGVPEQLRRWNKAGGKVVKGLINRREAEIALWNEPPEEISVSASQSNDLDQKSAPEEISASRTVADIIAGIRRELDELERAL